MASPTPLDLHRALARMMLELRRHPGMDAEVQRARREFAGTDVGDLDLEQQARTEARFAEWFVLERDSEVLGELPLAYLRRRLDGPSAAIEALEQSRIGVFAVVAGERLRVRDLQDHSLLEIACDELGALQPDDIVVGRLYGDADDALLASAATAVYPAGGPLLEALGADLAALELDRRLTQIEIEHVLLRRWRASAAAARGPGDATRLQQELAALLEGYGAGASAAEITAALHAAPQPGAVLGPVLERLAFNTQIDLDRARELLVALWNALHAESAAARAGVEGEAEHEAEAAGAGGILEGDEDGDADGDRAERGLGARVAARIERGLARSEDLEQLFAGVSDMLGEDPVTDEGEEPLGSAEGDLEPLVTEFLWEEQRAEDPDADLLGQLVRQQREIPVPRLDLERIEGIDLLRLLLRRYLEAPVAHRVQAVREGFAILERFLLWATRTQEYALEQPLQDCRAHLVDNLDRLHRAGITLSSPPREPGRPALLRVVHTGIDGFILAGAEGGAAATVADPAGAVDLRHGDLLLAAWLRSGDHADLAGPVIALPAAAEQLLGG